jgi:chromosome segregation ATPase
MYSRYLLVCSLLVSAPLVGWSEPENLGRLPDGRAYRVDSEGSQLVDHIAELELQKRDADFRIRALEADLKEKENQIGSLLSSRQREEPRFFEDDSVADCSELDRELRVVKTAFAKSKQARQMLEERLAKFEGREISLKKEVDGYGQQVSTYEDLLGNCKQSTNELKISSAELKKQTQDFQDKIQGLEEQNSKLEEQTLSYQTKLAATQEALRKQDSFRSRQTALEEEIQTKDSRIKFLEAQLTQSENTLEEVKISQASLSKRLASAETKLEEARRASEVVRARYQPPVAKIVKKDPNFEQFKAQAAKYIRDIERDRGLRAQLYSDYNSQAQKSVSFGLSDVRTSSGYDYPTVRSNVSRAETTGQLRVAIEQLKILRKILQDDINLLKRVR